MRYQYCPKCGAKLSLRRLGDDGEVPWCASCEMPWFDTFSTCVIALVTDGAGQVALLRQKYISNRYANLVSGYMQPGETAEEAAEIVEFALELRKRVKDTLIRIDETFERVDFAYRPKEGGAWKQVATLEELDYPATYHSLDKVPWEGSGIATEDAALGAFGEEPVASSITNEPMTDYERHGNEGSQAIAAPESKAPSASSEPVTNKRPDPKPGHLALRENQRGVSYEKLFGAYLEGAHEIEIIDPYVRTFHQCRNVMELLEVVVRHFKHDAPSIKVHLITAPDEYPDSKQEDYLERIKDSMMPLGLDFTWKIDGSGTLHARHLKIDNAWDILLDRGLDIWQRFDSNDAFSIEGRMPEMRRVKAFEITYMKVCS